MEHVGAYEAKTHLSKLLDRVAQGESITIERHGVPVAVLQPVDPARSEPVSATIDAIRRLRAKQRLDGVVLRDLIDEGRR